MKYLAFAFYQYYPSGGMNDCVGQFDTLDEAKNALVSHCADDNWIYKADEVSVRPLLAYDYGNKWTNVSDGDPEVSDYDAP